MVRASKFSLLPGGIWYYFLGCSRPSESFFSIKTLDFFHPKPKRSIERPYRIGSFASGASFGPPFKDLFWKPGPSHPQLHRVICSITFRDRFPPKRQPVGSYGSCRVVSFFFFWQSRNLLYACFPIWKVDGTSELGRLPGRAVNLLGLVQACHKGFDKVSLPLGAKAFFLLVSTFDRFFFWGGGVILKRTRGRGGSPSKQVKQG